MSLLRRTAGTQISLWKRLQRNLRSSRSNKQPTVEEDGLAPVTVRMWWNW